ncbi:Tyrosine recombinase XerD [subsurface metagenome]
MINTINDSEIQNLLSAAQLRDTRDFVMIFLALSSGLRCSELVGLFIEDVSPFGEVSRILTVPARIGKGGKKRDIPLNQDTRNVIENFIRIKETRNQFTNSDSFLFVSLYTRNPLSSRDFQRIVHDLSIKSIGRAITPHTLRHTYATRMLKHTNIRVIQELLGHAWLNTTQIYTHVSIDDAQQAISNFKLPEARK